MSADGPNINCTIWRLLDTKFKEMIHNSLLPFINCRIHVMKNAFPKDIIALGKQGQDLEGLEIDLQAWFKRSSCKEDDFKELSDKTILSLLFCYMPTKDG